VSAVRASSWDWERADVRIGVRARSVRCWEMERVFGKRRDDAISVALQPGHERRGVTCSNLARRCYRKIVVYVGGIVWKVEAGLRYR
jgi:hypothetical protein